VGAMRHKTLLALSLCVLGTGCVTKSVYDSALEDLAVAREATRRGLYANDLMRQQLTQNGGDIMDLKSALNEQEERVTELAVERAKLEQDLGRARAELATFQARAEGSERELSEALKTKANLKASVERMGEALGVLAARHAAAQARVAEYRDMLVRFRKMIDAGTLDVRVSEGRMVLSMRMDILFPTASTRLSPEGKEAIDEVGAQLATIPGKQFQVEGHTDDVPIHNERFASNWELAAGRALVVVHTLLSAGVEPTQLSAASFSQFKPREENRDDASRAKNRRIEIVVVPDLSTLPGNDELEQVSGERS
jgi:chemotaxis protein MotB